MRKGSQWINAPARLVLGERFWGVIYKGSPRDPEATLCRFSSRPVSIPSSQPMCSSWDHLPNKLLAPKEKQSIHIIAFNPQASTSLQMLPVGGVWKVMLGDSGSFPTPSFVGDLVQIVSECLFLPLALYARAVSPAQSLDGLSSCPSSWPRAQSS